MDFILLLVSIALIFTGLGLHLNHGRGDNQ